MDTILEQSYSSHRKSSPRFFFDQRKRERKGEEKLEFDLFTRKINCPRENLEEIPIPIASAT